MNRALIAGLLDPLFNPSHAMALIALGLLIGQQAQRWPALIAYVTGLATGSFAVAAAYASIYSSEAVFALTAISGLLVAAAMPLPGTFILFPAAAGGFVIAFDSPPDVFSIGAAVVMQLGTFVAAAIYLLAIVAIASALTRDWQRIGMRIVGSWFAASAILVLTLNLMR